MRYSAVDPQSLFVDTMSLDCPSILALLYGGLCMIDGNPLTLPGAHSNIEGDFIDVTISEERQEVLFQLRLRPVS